MSKKSSCFGRLEDIYFITLLYLVYFTLKQFFKMTDIHNDIGGACNCIFANGENASGRPQGEGVPESGEIAFQRENII
jgi:hypothetical protein